MHKFFLIISLTCISLSAMKQQFPSENDDLTSKEKELYQSLEAKLIGYFNTKLGVNYRKSDPKNDPMITRLLKTVVNRAFVLQDPEVTSALINKSELEHSDLWRINWVVIEAARSVLAERSSLKYIMAGNSDQPWPLREEFDQLLKEKRTELGLTEKHKMHQNIFPQLLTAKKPKSVRKEKTERSHHTNDSTSNRYNYGYGQRIREVPASSITHRFDGPVSYETRPQRTNNPTRRDNDCAVS